MENEPQLNINLKNTMSIKNSEGGSVFQQGIILRKVSKFIAGTAEDALIPIPVFYDPYTYKIFLDGLPKELREELKDESF
jgi:hypothetical protein